MILNDAVIIAERYKSLLSPYCERIEIAGSIRRRKPEVKDIEIVAIPKMMADNLFGDEQAPCQGFITTVNSWEKVKGSPTGKYTQRLLPEGIVLDLFIARPENWGLIYAIRTGSAEYSHTVLARGWKKHGYTSVDGMLTIDHEGTIEQIPVFEEEELYRLIGLEWIPPEQRNL